MEFLPYLLLLLFTLFSSNLCLISMQEPPSTTPPPPSPTPSPPPTLLPSPPTPPPPTPTPLPSPPPSSTPSPTPTSLPSPPIPPPPPPPPISLPPPPTPSSTPIIPPPPTPENVPSDFQEKQFLNIVDALIGAGDFAGYANFLTSANPLMIPLKSTLFIPSNDAFPSPTAAGLLIDPLIVAYHIVPQHLTFYDLKNLPVYSRIPTLLSSNFIVITNTSSHFSLDDAEVTDPDLYISPAFSVHGVSKILDYKAYGSFNITFNEADADNPQMRKGHNHQHKKRNSTNGFSGFGNHTSAVQSSSASDIFSMVFLVWGILLFV